MLIFQHGCICGKMNFSDNSLVFPNIISVNCNIITYFCLIFKPGSRHYFCVRNHAYEFIEAQKCVSSFFHTFIPSNLNFFMLFGNKISQISYDENYCNWNKKQMIYYSRKVGLSTFRENYVCGLNKHIIFLAVFKYSKYAV